MYILSVATFMLQQKGRIASYKREHMAYKVYNIYYLVFYIKLTEPCSKGRNHQSSSSDQIYFRNPIQTPYKMAKLSI